MKRFTTFIIILTAVLCFPFFVYAENETVENPEVQETVLEEGTSSDPSGETDPSVTDPSVTDPSVVDPSVTDPSVTDPEAEGSTDDPKEEPVEPKEEEQDPSKEEPSSEDTETETDPSSDPQADPTPEPTDDDKAKTEQETETPSADKPDEESKTTSEPTDEEKAKQLELDKARAESKNAADSITPVANSVWIETIFHPCNGHLLSGEKYGRLQGLTDFTFFTAQESGSYSAYTAGNNMVVLGKYQFTDFGAQGNGTATALIAYMYDCTGSDLYASLYHAFVVEKRPAVEEWNACALYDTENFMAMQDEFAYEHYYLTGEAAVEAAGISLSTRPWVVKGLCFSIFNALGPYDVYGSGAYAITTAGIQNEDSNAVFIEKVCANMVSLYADEYLWMYGRYYDGTDTAIGVSDKDLALEILNGSLYADPEPVTDLMADFTVNNSNAKAAKKQGFSIKDVSVIAKVVREYSGETEIKPLQVSRDYTISCKLSKKRSTRTITIRGKGQYEGQWLKKTLPFSASRSEE